MTFTRPPRSIERGHGIVYYAALTGLVFAAGRVTSYPYKLEEEWTPDWPWRVDVSIEVFEEFIHNGVRLGELNVEDRDLRRSIRQKSHIRLSDAEYAAAVKLLT